MRAKAARIPGKFAEILCWNEQENRPRQPETLMKSAYLSLALGLSLDWRREWWPNPSPADQFCRKLAFRCVQQFTNY